MAEKDIPALFRILASYSYNKSKQSILIHTVLHVSNVSILPDAVQASTKTKNCSIHHIPISALNSQTSPLLIFTPSLPFPTTKGITPKQFPDSGYTLVVSTVRLLMNTSITLTSKNSLISRSSGLDEQLVVDE